MNGAPRQIVIVGRDAALGSPHRAPARTAPAGVSVTAVDCHPVERILRLCIAAAVGSAARQARGWTKSALLSRDRRELLAGDNVVGAADTAPFFLAHGSYGAPIDGSSFFPMGQGPPLRPGRSAPRISARPDGRAPGPHAAARRGDRGLWRTITVITCRFGLCRRAQARASGSASPCIMRAASR